MARVLVIHAFMLQFASVSPGPWECLSNGSPALPPNLPSFLASTAITSSNSTMEMKGKIQFSLSCSLYLLCAGKQASTGNAYILCIVPPLVLVCGWVEGRNE